MNLRPGIDTPPPSELLLAKLNLPFDDGAKAVTVLKEIEAVTREACAPARALGTMPDGLGGERPARVVEDLRLNLLVAFGLRFFLGAHDQRAPDPGIPNFPPGGQFPPRVPTRFGLHNRRVPLYLRRMAAAGDREWVAKHMQKPLDSPEVAAAYEKWVSAAESDLLLYFEATRTFLLYDFWERIRTRVVLAHGLELVGPLQHGWGRGDGRDHIGWSDPISNMQEMIRDRPQEYRRHIYLPHPAPAYPGEPTENRDDPLYDGSTYLVHRKYYENIERWNSDTFSVTEANGRTYHGEEARNMAIGRDRETGRVIHRSSGRTLDHEYDSQEVHLAPPRSHVLQARGGNPAPFKGPFPPVAEGDEHVFHIQDIRIRRRGASFADVERATGAVRYGLHFMCFQNNIQQTGFEFINNIWLMNPAFRGSTDHLFDVDRGIVEPAEGCYYFVPPEHRDYPGDILFE